MIWGIGKQGSMISSRNESGDGISSLGMRNINRNINFRKVRFSVDVDKVSMEAFWPSKIYRTGIFVALSGVFVMTWFFASYLNVLSYKFNF